MAPTINLQSIAAAGRAAYTAARNTLGWGAPDRGHDTRITAPAQTIPAPWQERDPAVLGDRLTPTVMAAAIHDRNVGNFRVWTDVVAEIMSKNPHLITQLGVRRASVSETRFLVRPGEGSNGRAARRAAADFEALVKRWHARQEWDPLLGQLVAAEWWGRSLHEVLWSDEAGFMAPERLAWIHHRRLSYACPYGDPEPWTIRIHDSDAPTSPFFGAYGVPISEFHPDKFVLHETTPLGVHRTGEGLSCTLVWYLLMYEWDWRDLMKLVELLGRPGHIGYYAAGGAKAAERGTTAGAPKFDGPKAASPEDQNALYRAVLSVSGSLRAVLPDTTRVEPLQYTQRATPLQLEVAKHIEGLISKAITGSNGVTDIVAGARAAHEVAWMQSLTYWRYDVRRVCGWLNDLARRMVQANPGRYGMNCPPPEMWSPDVERTPDDAADGKGGKNDPSKGEGNTDTEDSKP